MKCMDIAFEDRKTGQYVTLEETEVLTGYPKELLIHWVLEAAERLLGMESSPWKSMYSVPEKRAGRPLRRKTILEFYDKMAGNYSSVLETAQAISTELENRGFNVDVSRVYRTIQEFE